MRPARARCSKGPKASASPIEHQLTKEVGGLAWPPASATQAKAKTKTIRLLAWARLILVLKLSELSRILLVSYVGAEDQSRYELKDATLSDKPEQQSDFEIVEIKKSEESWSKYTLADGTTLRVRPVVVEVVRLVGQYDPNGDPLYQAKTALIVDAKIPTRLKKPKSSTHETG